MPVKSLEKWETGNCAEAKAINEALCDQQKREGRTRKEDLQVAAVYTKGGSPKQLCKNCLRMASGMRVSPATGKKAKGMDGK